MSNAQSVQKIRFAFEEGEFQDFYKLLGVNMDATDEELKSRYKFLSKFYHPDAPTGDAVLMGKISKAYNFLKDPAMRSVYNLFYLDKIDRENGTQDVSMESAESEEPVTQDVPMESVESEEPDTQNVSMESVEPEESMTPEVSKESVQQKSSNHGNSKNRNSSYTKNYRNSTKRRGTSYHFEISPNAIRNTLRNHHYSEETIRNFLSWCQEHHMRITNGKELHSVFLKYLSMSKETKESKKSIHLEPEVFSRRKNERYHLRRENRYHHKRNTNQNVKKGTRHTVIFHFPFQREFKACQAFIKNYSSSICNLQIFEFPSFVTLARTIQNVTVFLNANKNQDKKKKYKNKTLLKKAS